METEHRVNSNRQACLYPFVICFVKTTPIFIYLNTTNLFVVQTHLLNPIHNNRCLRAAGLRAGPWHAHSEYRPNHFYMILSGKQCFPIGYTPEVNCQGNEKYS